MWERVKNWVVEAVSWAERDMKGKTGAEKKTAVVKKVDDLVPLPWFLEWLDDIVIGWLVDMVCDKMNWLTDHAFTGTELNEEQTQKLAAVAVCSVASVPEVKGQTVAEKLDALYQAHGITAPEREKKADTPDPDTESKDYQTALKVAYSAQKGDLTRHFSKSEFACKCGCGFDSVAPELVERLEKMRSLCGDNPLRINSACRCEKHNAKVGGGKKSQHLLGTAADIRKIPGMTVDEMAKKAEEAGFRGIGKYNWGVHVDVRATPARWDYRK